MKATLEQFVDEGTGRVAAKVSSFTPCRQKVRLMRCKYLQPVVPQAKFTLGTDSSKLIAWAYPEDHTRSSQASGRSD